MSLFPNFKQYNIDIDLYINFLPGSGGNFLASLLNNHKSNAVISNNEYRSYDHIPNFVDDFFIMRYYQQCNSVEFNPYDLDHKELYIPISRQQGIFGKKLPFYRKSAVCLSHTTPYLLCNIFSCNIKEHVHITHDPDTKWFINALKVIKGNLSFDFSNKGTEFKVVRILNRYKKFLENMIDNSNSITDYVLDENEITTSLSRIFDNHPLIKLGSVTSFDFYFFCKLNNIIPTEDSFIKFFKSILISEIDDDTNITWNSVYTTAVKNHSSTFQEITYEDLFFKLDIPSNSILQNLDKEKIREYSYKNIELVRQLVPYTNNHTIIDKLNLYKSYLDK